MNDLDTKSLVIPSDPNDVKVLEKVDELAVDVSRNLSFNEDDQDNISIAVTEAVNNAILHGNQGDPGKKVTVRFLVLENGLQIEVSDEGGGFNPDNVPDPTDEENLLSESGRGLLIIQHLMDEVKLVSESNGMKMVMFKKFST